VLSSVHIVSIGEAHVIAGTSEPEPVPSAHQADVQGGSVRALERGLRIIRCFSATHPSWSIAGLSEAVGLHKATTRRLVKTLEAEGFLAPDADPRQYCLGSALLPVAYLTRSNEELIRIARPHIERLAARTEETAVISVWTDSGPLLIFHVPTEHFFKPTMVPGSMSPELGSTHSKIFLAFGPEDRQSKLLVADRERPTTLAELVGFQEKLTQVRMTGIAYDLEERIRGVCALGVPVRNGTGEVIASIAVVVPKDRFGEAEQETFSSLAREAAANLSGELGFRDESSAWASAETPTNSE
jgi:DNA-binding IclR family transcriptional regulator